MAPGASGCSASHCSQGFGSCGIARLFQESGAELSRYPSGALPGTQNSDLFGNSQKESPKSNSSQRKTWKCGAPGVFSVCLGAFGKQPFPELPLSIPGKSAHPAFLLCCAAGMGESSKFPGISRIRIQGWLRGQPGKGGTHSTGIPWNSLEFWCVPSSGPGTELGIHWSSPVFSMHFPNSCFFPCPSCFSPHPFP